MASTPELISSTWVSQTINPINQQRSSSQTSYLNEAIKNTSIVVYTRNLATKILFNGNNTATGVSVQTAGCPTYFRPAAKSSSRPGYFNLPNSSCYPASAREKH